MSCNIGFNAGDYCRTLQSAQAQAYGWNMEMIIYMVAIKVDCPNDTLILVTANPSAVHGEGTELKTYEVCYHVPRLHGYHRLKAHWLGLQFKSDDEKEVHTTGRWAGRNQFKQRNHQGFYIQIRYQPANNDCGYFQATPLEAGQSTTVIQSEQWPYGYNPDTHCRFHVFSEENTKIQMHFNRVTLYRRRPFSDWRLMCEPQTDDTLYVFGIDGCENQDLAGVTSGGVKKHFCGMYRRSRCESFWYNTNANNVCVYFHAQGYLRNEYSMWRGMKFQISFKAVAST